MTINISVPEEMESPELKPRISVIGVGGAGGNAVNNMIAANLEGCDFIVANTDAQALAQSKAERRIQLGEGLTKGLGAGSKPEVGRAAAEEAIEEILETLDGSNMVFIAAGMGGGTGTGAAPVIARAAKDRGILTVGVVTKPFQFEGSHRMRLAEGGLQDLEQFVDTQIIIPNQNLFRVANEKTTFGDAFRMADDVLYSGVRSITDLMVMPGLINLDFADVQSVMSGMGRAMMGTGEAEGERRALDAAEAAISNPLLDDASMRGARGVLINITGGQDITLFEVDEAANRVRSEVDEDAYIIIGSAFDGELDGRMRVSVVATGIAAEASGQMPHMGLLGAGSRLTPVQLPADESEASEDDLAAVAKILDAVLDDDDSPAADGAPMTDTESILEEALKASAAEAETGSNDVPDVMEIPAADIPAALGSAGAGSAPQPAQPATPDAMPGSGATESFIPPKPVAPIAHPAAAEAQADPFEVADIVNGAGAQEGQGSGAAAAAQGTEEDQPARKREAGLFKRVRKERGLSLFERVTGTGRAAERDPEDALVAASAHAAAGNVTQAEFTAKAQTPAESEQNSQIGGQTAADRAAGKLGGIDPADRIPAAEPEEDLLDIPAFLRRQAN